MSSLNEPVRHLARRLALGVCGLATAAWMAAAQAQSLTPESPAPPSAPAYQDNYIRGGALAPDITAGDEITSNSQGPYRSLQVDGVVSWLGSHSGGASSNELEDGFIVRSQWETADFGSWSLDGSARTGASSSGPSFGPTDQGQGGTIALRERGMPFDGNWQTDNALGDINTPDIGLVQFQPRFYLPTSPMQGLTTDWRGPDGLDLTAGGGVPGVYEGIAVPDFHTLGGSIATAGAQWSPAAHWTIGGQFVDANDVNLAVGPVIEGVTTISSTTSLLSAAWQDKGERLQLNLMDGDVSGKPSGTAAWLDGSMTQGAFLQSAGLFRIDPNMTGGNQLIADDMQGGYYRLGYQTRQWLTDIGVDEVRSVSGMSADTTFLTGDARYQLSRDWGIGTVGNLSRTDGADSWSVEGYVDHVNRWGMGRVQADYADTTTGRSATLTLNQNWSSSVDLRLSTSAYVQHVSGALYTDVQQTSTVLGIAASGGAQLTGRVSLDGNIQWAGAIQGRAAPAVSTNISLTWQVSQYWKVLLTYYDTETGSWTPPTVVSPLTPPSETVIPAISERGAFLTVRYQRSAGSHFAPLGGRVGTGAGEIRGTVYLDANNNGLFDAGETGAPNVTVVLDGQFSVQTDANGRFDFPSVVAGHHVITVQPDNVPLPWQLTNSGRKEVDVSTRGITEADIGAVRIR
jgi:hypothetical protein